MEPIITIKDWQTGIADSQHLGTALLKNVEVDKFPGAVRVGKIPTAVFESVSAPFTADAASNVCTLTSGTLGTLVLSGTAIQFTTTGALPAPLATGTNYFLIRNNSTQFKVATTIANALAGTAVDISDAGTGVQTIATINPGTIRHFARDPRTGTTFATDSLGHVWYDAGSIWRLLNGNTETSSDGNGLAILRTSDGNATYLFNFRNAAIDVVNVFGNTQIEAPSWSNSWKTMNSGAGSGNSHKAHLGQDNIIYFCDDRYVGSIREIPGQVFDPSNSATYTYNNQALDLPLGSLSYWLEELGVNLLVSVSNDFYVYPWDRTSDSYGLPLPLPELGNKMKNIGNVVYILAGLNGNIYTTQGTYTRLFKTLPQYVFFNSTSAQSNPMSWGGISSALGNLLVGVGAGTGTNSGVYKITPEGVLTIDAQTITGSGGNNVTALYATSEFYHMGYAGNIDEFGGSRYSTLGSTVDLATVAIQSALYRLDNKVTKGKISRIEAQLATGLTGQIRVSYRTASTGSWTEITTWVTSSSVTSYTFDCGLTDLENIQFQIELAGNLDLMEFRAYP